MPWCCFFVRRWSERQPSALFWSINFNTLTFEAFLRFLITQDDLKSNSSNSQNTLYGSKLSIFFNAKNHCSMKIFCTLNFIWTTLKAIFAIFRCFTHSDSRFSNSCISGKYCPTLTNHASTESLLIQLWWCRPIHLNFKLKTGFVIHGQSHLTNRICKGNAHIVHAFQIYLVLV